MSRAKKKKGKIFVISGPSGSGKTTLLEKLLGSRGLKKKLVKSISLTTRPKRSGEKEGKHYFFITEGEFRQRLREKKILEWTRYLGYYYATPRFFVERQLQKGKNIALCLDLKGVRAVKRFYPKDTVTIFIAPPSVKELRNRIISRCKKTKKTEVGERLKLAKQEIRARGQYTYCLLNEDFQQAVNCLRDIVLREITS